MKTYEIQIEPIDLDELMKKSIAVRNYEAERRLANFRDKLKGSEPGPLLEIKREKVEKDRKAWGLLLALRP